MSQEEFNEAIKNYIKENVSVLVETKQSGSECYYSETVAVNLYIGKELISSSEIERLSFCH